MIASFVRIPVGVVVERTKSASQWVDYLWKPIAVLAGEAATAPWTKLNDDGERTTFYAGMADITLHASETSHYRDNLATGTPNLWVVLRSADTDPPYQVFTVTADPFEGEGMTAAGEDIVEPVPMPEPIRDALEEFVAAHHVEQPFVKRQRDRANPDALARREPRRREDGV